MRLTPEMLALAAAVNVRRRAAPLESRCRCEVRSIDYWVTIAPLLTEGPEREALLARARTERCPRCHRLRYGDGLAIQSVDWQTSDPPVPVVTNHQDGAR